LIDFRFVDIKAYDCGASSRKLDRQRQTDIAKSDNANIHTQAFPHAVSSKSRSTFTAGRLLALD
jgi:uncharacterized membrane protein